MPFATERPLSGDALSWLPGGVGVKSKAAEDYAMSSAPAASW